MTLTAAEQFYRLTDVKLNVSDANREWLYQVLLLLEEFGYDLEPIVSNVGALSYIVNSWNHYTNQGADFASAMIWTIDAIMKG